MERLAYRRVIIELVAAVPELRPVLDRHIRENDEILQHVFLGVDVAPFVLAAWNEGRADIVARCLDFLEEAAGCADRDTRGLVCVSFVEAVEPWRPERAAFVATWPEALAREAARLRDGTEPVDDGPVPGPTRARSLDGLTFAPSARPEHGEVDASTRFVYHERDGAIWAEYAGGDIVRGYLVGTRTHDTLDFRYVQANRTGGTSSGHCVSAIVTLADGRVRLDETWEWESRPGSGTSTVVQVGPGTPVADPEDERVGPVR